ncbi:hypothetical protein BH23BAC1_BH23BAC1_39770 [soil metagenome]
MKQLIFFLCLALIGCRSRNSPPATSPIQLHPENGRYFLFRGDPTILISSAEHYGAAINMDFDYVPYLEELASKDLNYTRIFAGSYVEDPGAFNIEKNTLAPKEGRFIAPWSRSSTPGYDNGGNKFDLDQWDQQYFDRLTNFVSKAGENGIVVEMTFFSSLYGDEGWKSSPLNKNNNINSTDSVHRLKVHTMENGNILSYQEKMVRKIVNELNNFDNVIFEIQNEPWADDGVKANLELRSGTKDEDDASLQDWQKKVDIANDASLEWQRKISSIIVDEESRLPQKHLIAQNIANFRFNISDPDPNISVFNFHYALPEVVYENLYLNKVIGFDESGFAGSEDDTYRKQAWHFILAGGGLFNNLDYSFTTSSPEGQDNQSAPGGGSEEFRKQLMALKDYMYSFDFISMKPDNAILEDKNLKARALVNPGIEYGVYFQELLNDELVLNIPKGNYNIEWIDVRDGNVLESQELKHNGGKITIFTPDFNSDLALKMKNKD